MKKCTLGYFKYGKGNVGDDLNAWLWPQILQHFVFENNTDNVLIGVGSILDSRFDHYKKKLVLGAGARIESSVPQLDDTWDIKFVRGPKTQKALKKQLDVKYITDPAILIGEYFKKRNNAQKIGFIPYFKSDHKRWEIIAKHLGFTFISPQNSVEDFAQQLSECKFVITEAMHGAIFADAMRIPWFSVSSFTHLSEGETHLFKWQDWCESMEMTFTEIKLPMLWPNDNRVKRLIKNYIIYRKLKKISLNDCYLSSDEFFNKKTQQIKDLCTSL